MIPVDLLYCSLFILCCLFFNTSFKWSNKTRQIQSLSLSGRFPSYFFCVLDFKWCKESNWKRHTVGCSQSKRAHKSVSENLYPLFRIFFQGQSLDPILIPPNLFSLCLWSMGWSFSSSFYLLLLLIWKEDKKEVFLYFWCILLSFFI